MKNFTFYRPGTLDQALGLLDTKWGGTELLAGGTDLHDLQKEYVAQPTKVVSLTGIGDLEGIYKLADHISIRPNTKLSAIAENKVLRELFPALTEAAAIIGGPQIRNMGTLGGNLGQRNRCWYFRDEHVDCLLKGGSKCYALDGDNRYHAIFTQGLKCVYVHPSTLAPVLIALGAIAEVTGPKGKKDVPLAKFFQAACAPDQRETVLEPNQVITAVRIPSPEGQRSASYEVRHKQAYDWPLVQAAVAFGVRGNKAFNVRIVLGHVAPTPHVAEAAAKEIEGKDVTEETAATAGRAAAKGAKPLSQNAYKVKLVEVAVKRALLTAAGAKKYWEV